MQSGTMAGSSIFSRVLIAILHCLHRPISNNSDSLFSQQHLNDINMRRIVSDIA